MLLKPFKLHAPCLRVHTQRPNLAGAKTGLGRPNKTLQRGPVGSLRSGGLKLDNKPPVNKFSSEKPGQKSGISKKGSVAELGAARTMTDKQPRGSRKKAIPKKRVRPRVRMYENDIKVLPDGREVCLTEEAWQKRREERWRMDGMICQGKIFGLPHGIEVGLSEAQIHHVRKRSLGRDDRLENLITFCEACHLAHHTEGSGQ